MFNSPGISYELTDEINRILKANHTTRSKKSNFRSFVRLIYLSTWLPVSLSVRLPTYLPTYLSIYLSMTLQSLWTFAAFSVS
jgi:hypothetical protein